jgi:hypothetical protein
MHYVSTICQLRTASCNRPPNAMLCGCVCPGKCQLCYGSCKNITGLSSGGAIVIAWFKQNNETNHSVARTVTARCPVVLDRKRRAQILSTNSRLARKACAQTMIRSPIA